MTWGSGGGRAERKADISHGLDVTRRTHHDGQTDETNVGAKTRFSYSLSSDDAHPRCLALRA